MLTANRKMRGLAMILAGIMAFLGTFVNLGMPIWADDPTIYECNLNVSSYDGTMGSVKYTQNGESWTVVDAQNGVSDVTATAVLCVPEPGCHLVSFRFNGDLINNSDHADFFTQGNKSVSDIIFESDDENGGEEQPPAFPKLTVASYDDTYGNVKYCVDHGEDNFEWVTVGPNGVQNVEAVAVVINPIEGYRLSDSIVCEPSVFEDNEQHQVDMAGGLKCHSEIWLGFGQTFSISSISFEEGEIPANDNPGDDGSIQIKATAYDDTHGKIQYSIDENEWSDIPATGISEGVEGAFVRAVPDADYSVSYKIDGNNISDTGSHGLELNPSLHWIQDITFTSSLKKLTVSAYDTQYGKIQYSSDGTAWIDVAATGGEYTAKYVRATAAEGGVLDSYKLNNTLIASDTSQKLTNDTAITDVSFIAGGGTGGKYTVNIECSDGVNETTTITFLNKNGQTLASTQQSVQANDIPAGTAKIRIAVAGEREFMRTTQVIRKNAGESSTDNMGTEIERRPIEDALWNNGVAEFTANEAFSYKINIVFNKKKNVRWRYPSDRGTGDTQEDEIVEHAKLYRLNAQSDTDIDLTDYDLNKDQELTIGETYYFLLIPDYGYQVSSLQINAGPNLLPIAGNNNMGVFKFTMVNSNFHFKGIVSEAQDIVYTDSTTVSNATIANGENATDSGNVKLTVKDAPLDTDAVDVVGEGAMALGTVDIDLNKVVSMGNGNYWSSDIYETTGAVVVGLMVDLDDISAQDELSVVREHDGVRTELDAEYDPDTKMLTFASDRFSNYTIIKKAADQEGEESPVANDGKDADDDDDSDTSNTSGDGNNNDNTPPAVNNSLGTLVGGSEIKTWQDLENILIDTANKTGAKNNRKGQRELVQVVLNRTNSILTESVFKALRRSNLYGLHTFVGNGTALTFINDNRLNSQQAVDLSCKVTTGSHNKKIEFKTYTRLKARTVLHTVVPTNVKSVMLYKYDANGVRKLVGRLTPTDEGRVCFAVSELTTYELVY
ncbi:MAG: hypothetical protein J5525_01510 [Lachnospiraceae bacterium]|nr:hypothetical protein [Lachnospiraceae bacterium]